MPESTHSVQEKNIESQLVASFRMKGKYSDCGVGFKRIGRAFGRYLCGTPMLLCHDSEYRENDADYEVVMPIKQGESTDEISVYELPGGRCLSIMHVGPYEAIGDSYAKIFDYAKEHSHEFVLPTRSVYHKGPGMIFKGNPKKYLTEIQLMLEQSPDDSGLLI